MEVVRHIDRAPAPRRAHSRRRERQRGPRALAWAPRDAGRPGVAGGHQPQDARARARPGARRWPACAGGAMRRRAPALCSGIFRLRDRRLWTPQHDAQGSGAVGDDARAQARRQARRTRVLEGMEAPRARIRLLFVPSPALAGKTGGRRCCGVSLPRRVDPPASRPADSRRDARTRGLIAGRSVQSRCGRGSRPPWVSNLIVGSNVGGVDMTKGSIGLCALALCATFARGSGDAARVGGARSTGVQRSVPKSPPAATPAKPAQQQGAPNQAAPAAQPQPSGLARWMPMLGGLALGGLLGYLFAGNGLGGVLLLALLAVGAVLLFRMLARRAPQSPRPVQYAGMDRETTLTPPPAPAPGAAMRTDARFPAGFDATSFLRGAKTNFVKLQIAN